MSWRVVVVTGVAKLDLKMGFLVVRKESTTKIHISEIHTMLANEKRLLIDSDRCELLFG